MSPNKEVVWLLEERRFVFLESRGATLSEISWIEDGITYYDTVENNDYEFWHERAIEFEPDE